MMKTISLILSLALAAGGVATASEAPTFERAFAPQNGLVSVYEQSHRSEICLNGRWKFSASDELESPAEVPSGIVAWDEVPIKVPSPWNVNSFSMTKAVQGGDFRTYPSYPESWDDAKAAWMEKEVEVPADWKGQRVLLDFAGVAGKLAVFVNDQKVGEGFDLFFPHRFDVTDAIRSGEKNRILVNVVSPKVFDDKGKFGKREYLAGSFWGIHIAGIWQDVNLMAVPQVSVSDVFVKPLVSDGKLAVEVTLDNQSKESATLTLDGVVREWINGNGKDQVSIPEVRWSLADKASLEISSESEVTVPAGESKKIELIVSVSDQLKFWSPDAPNLYGLVLNVKSGDKAVDTKYQRFGWREFKIKGREVFLNGEPIVLNGDSWHFMGVAQMTRRYAYAWYQLLKDAGANAVRPHAMIYPSFYLEMADEMGIMVLDETSIWVSDGNPKVDSDLFWENCRDHVEKMVLRDRNHPSVFGWSVVNEILPVLRHVWHAPQPMVDRCVEEIAVWRDLCYKHDPTREWISGDGEWDAEGELPTINIHYGDWAAMKKAMDSGKPWGVGETSMAYYGTPRQISKMNGNRAYESALGRMEGLAFECYKLLSEQQKYEAAYLSVFNMAWYSVKPLALGQRDTTRAPELKDGVFFGEYQEGVYGMQPERLGPYSTTLNPGYDPELPLYEAWPMFDAVRDAYTGKKDSPWAKLPEKPEEVKAAETAEGTLSYLPKNAGALLDTLQVLGASAAEWKKADASTTLLVNAADVSTLDEAVSSAVKETLAAGGRVWIWGTNGKSASAVSELVGGEVTAAERSASSFVVKKANGLLKGLDNAEWYFSEEDDWKQLEWSLGGKWVESSGMILEACPVEWRNWNYQPEPVKTAALYRTEKERTAPLGVIASGQVDGGEVILCNLSPKVDSTKKRWLLQRLLLNGGIKVESSAAGNEFLTLSGQLVKFAVSDRFPFENIDEAYGSLPDFVQAANDSNAGWQDVAIEPGGLVDFRKLDLEGPEKNAVSYVSLWIKSSKPLNDLLSEPNMPKLSMVYGCDDGAEIWLNGELLQTKERIGPHEAGAFRVDPLLLKLGWNQVIAKVVQGEGDWKFSAGLECTQREFLDKLEFSTSEPEE